ncbi:acyl-CoA (8-3)-desaturase-like isoform X1 [Tiliqua scincoides]|uniref:acyl-CoA (8-3)-desaturase-like isoform X1 n=1 Tax=Tiliqua scincoides TaxID=71010 RepID=UPI0034634642
MAPQEGAAAGKGQPEAGAGSPRLFTWEEVALRNGQGRPAAARWLVIDRKVYDVSRFHKKHPGGSRVISGCAGQDATDAFTAFHLDKTLVRKYMKSLLIGELAPHEPSFEHSKNKLLVEDFRELRSTVEKLGLLKPNHLFFFLLFLHILLLEAAGWFVLWYFGISVNTFLISIVLLTLAQCQTNWLEHDLGHLSVFSSPKWNHIVHEFVMCHLKGVSANWWIRHHSQHHSKPNCFLKDPDLALHPIPLSVGEIPSMELGRQKKKYMPYNHQHQYFSFTLPPVVVLIFQAYSLYYIFKQKLWREIAWIVAYFVRFFVSFVPFFGVTGALGYLLLIKITDSIIFIWISQSSHIPMLIDYDKNLDWFSTQLQSTCNVHQSLFNDWLTGHLNFQIEHHLFPTMPRHNYWKVTPLVKSMCAKHGIEYQSKTLFTGFADILRSLKVYGEIWFKAYHQEQEACTLSRE